MSVSRVPSVSQACPKHGESKRVPVSHPLRGDTEDTVQIGGSQGVECVPTKNLISGLPELKFSSPSLPSGWRPTIVIDSREQAPLPVSFPSVTAGLPTGDYSVLGLENDFCVERKSLSDLYGSLTSGRERFTRELQRMKAYRFARLLIIGSVHEIEAGSSRHRGINPKAILNSLAAIEARGVPVVFATDPRAAAQLVQGWAFWSSRESLKQASQLVKQP